MTTLVELASTAMKCRENLDMIALMNSPANPEDKVELDVQYRIAERLWRKADDEYRKALDSYIQETCK